MGGSCGSVDVGAVGTGNIPITLTQPDNVTPLAAGTYSDCTLTVVDGLGNTSNVVTLTAFVIDTTASVLTEVTPVATPANDTTPAMTFSNTKAGTLSMGGSCGSVDVGAVGTGNIPITLTQPDNVTPLAAGTYSDCTLTVVDGLGNTSNVVTLTAFVIDTTASVLTEVTPVATPANDTTPAVTFSNTKAGTLSMGGSCGSVDVGAVGTGNIPITLTQPDNVTPLAAGTYSDCTLTVVDGLGNTSNVVTLTAFVIDTTASVLTEVTPVATPANDTTPAMTFSNTKAGTLSMGGSCGSVDVGAVGTGNIPITLTQPDNVSPLTTGTYNNCTLTVVDGLGNTSNVLPLTSFVVDALVPTININAVKTLNEGSAGNTISAAQLSSTDNLSGAANVVYTLVSTTNNGTLRKSGSALLGGATFTQTDINSSFIAYDHDGSETTSDTFKFTVRDQVGNINNNTAANFTFSFTITSVNDQGIVIINGAPTRLQGEILTSNVSDAEGTTPADINYQWKRNGNDINGANASTYVSVQADVGSPITVTASYNDNLGSAENVISNGVVILNTNDPGVATIDGTPEEGQTLTANISDDDGTPTNISYQWKRDGINIIPGGTAKTYIPVQVDVDKDLTVAISYTDPFGATSVTSSKVTIANVNDMGVVTINGTATQGQPLTANIADADGATTGISYQWRRGVTDISSGGTAKTYVPVQADVNEVLTVVISYSDPFGSESVMSAPTLPVVNVNDTGIATISGTRTQGQTLTANISDADGTTPGTFTYQWERNGRNISGATTKTYVLAQDDVGNPIRVIVNYTDNLGGSENVTSSATSSIVNVNDVGVVEINGTATKGQTLTANVTDIDGEPVSINYQWMRNGSNIFGATAKTYILKQADVGSTIRVTVNYTDVLGGSENVTSLPTVEVAGVNNTGVATINGTPTENQTLTVSITDTDGTTGSTFTYQWKRGGADISGAIAATYNLVQGDVGNPITVTVNYADDLTNAESVTSGPTVFVTNVNDTGVAMINGIVMDGATLTASVTDVDGTLTSAFSYQWKRNGSDITGATLISYVLQPEDIGSAITVTVSYTDDLDGVENITSNATAAILDMTAPDITLPDDVTVDAEGLFTLIKFGVATANDNKDGPLTPTSNAPNRFSPGITEVEWRVSDAAGNEAIATQTVIVRPLVDFAADLLVAKNATDSTVSFRIFLNGKVSYPVDVPYFVDVSSTANSSDHDLISDTVTISSDSDFAEVSFTIKGDDSGEGVKNIKITMGTATPDAVAVTDASININITEENIAPVASLSAIQAAVKTRTIKFGGGSVSVSSDVIDLNAGDPLIYDWSATDNALSDSDGNVTDSTFEFNPSELSTGFYTLRLTVSDGSDTTEAELTLNILSDAPASTIPDSDNDGLPDSLDSDKANILPSQRLLYTSRLLETQGGLKFALGDVAFRAGKGQANVTMADISNTGQSSDTGFAYPSGLFDFDITGLGEAGQSINVVLPQQVAIPANATYRQLLASNWQEFVIDDNNAIATAPGALGFCPPPGDVKYQAGLAEGHFCVQLTIQDGGANDGDGAANNRISDPGGVAIAAAVPLVDPPSKSDDSNGIFGLGSLSVWWLSLFGLFGLRNCCIRTE